VSKIICVLPKLLCRYVLLYTAPQNGQHHKFHYKHVKYERPGLTTQEIDEIKDAFALFDDRKDGAYNATALCFFH
jgi:hypothetical protein